VPAAEALSVDGVDGAMQIWWDVDGKKVMNKDRQLVSPPFALGLPGGELMFMFVLRPKKTETGGFSSNFAKAGGKGTIELHCMGAVDMELNQPLPSQPLVFQLGVGAERELLEARPANRTAASHRLPIAKLSEHDVWDFQRHVSPRSGKMLVCLQVGAGSATVLCL